MKNTWNSFHYYHHLYENTPTHTLSRGAAQLNRPRSLKAADAPHRLCRRIRWNNNIINTEE